MLSTQLAAATRAESNRSNSLKSTGPRTAEGKQRSKFNARTHNLTGQTVVSEETDLEAYFSSSARLLADLKPEGEYEARLVQSLADAQWQLDRARAVETNLFFKLASACLVDQPAIDTKEPAGGWAIAQAQAFHDHAKQFDLISRYLTRYHRQVLQLHSALTQLQATRRKSDSEREAKQLELQHRFRQFDSSSGSTGRKQDGNSSAGFDSQNASEPTPDFKYEGAARSQTPSFTTRFPLETHLELERGTGNRESELS